MLTIISIELGGLGLSAVTDLLNVPRGRLTLPLAGPGGHLSSTEKEAVDAWRDWPLGH